MPRLPKTDLEDLNLLDLKPRKVADWTETDGKVLLQLPVPERSWRRPFAYLSYKIWNKRVRLDQVGSTAWLLFDGRRTVADVAEELRLEFAEQVEPAEERLGILVRMLHRGGLIAYDEQVQAGSSTDLLD